MTVDDDLRLREQHDRHPSSESARLVGRSKDSAKPRPVLPCVAPPSSKVPVARIPAIPTGASEDAAALQNCRLAHRSSVVISEGERAASVLASRLLLSPPCATRRG